MSTPEIVVAVSLAVMLLGGAVGVVLIAQGLYALAQDVRDSLFGDALEAQYAETQQMMG